MDNETLQKTSDKFLLTLIRLMVNLNSYTINNVAITSSSQWIKDIKASVYYKEIYSALEVNGRLYLMQQVDSLIAEEVQSAQLKNQELNKKEISYQQNI